MDNLIEAYINETYHPDLVDTMRKAFSLFEAFELPDYESEFIDLLMMEDMESSQNTQDHFTTILHKKLDTVIQCHLIIPMEAAHIHEKVGLIEALYNIQHLTDYSSIVHTLEADYDPIERLAEVLSTCGELTPIAIENMILEFNPSILETLKQFVYAKESETDTILTSTQEFQRKIIRNLRSFKDFLDSDLALIFKGKPAIGLTMLESNVMVGQDLELYIPFIDAQLKHQDYPKLALDVYSIILLSDEGYNNPVGTFKKNCGWLLDDLTAISKVDPLYMTIANAFDKYKLTLTTERQNDEQA